MVVTDEDFDSILNTALIYYDIPALKTPKPLPARPDTVATRPDD